MNYSQLNGKSIRAGFNEFNKKNPHVYKSFEEQVLKAIEKGRTKLSAKLIINWIRWNDILRTSDQNFKINDAYQSYYARHFIKLNPQHSEIFNLRKLRNEEVGSYMSKDKIGTITFE
tara:strand:+ start:10745 stop:11095 length:351 start_codon:yes stop_codon:yes gene_type:complete